MCAIFQCLLVFIDLLYLCDNVRASVFVITLVQVCVITCVRVCDHVRASVCVPTCCTSLSLWVWVCARARRACVCQRVHVLQYISSPSFAHTVSKCITANDVVPLQLPTSLPQLTLCPDSYQLNYPKSFAYFAQAARKRHSEALCSLGAMHYSQFLCVFVRVCACVRDFVPCFSSLCGSV